MLSFKIIDLTHEIHETIPCWDGNCGFHHKTTIDYSDCDSDIKFKVQEFSMRAGIGTHIDAPAHFIADGKTVETLPLQISPCVVIDVSDKATDKYTVTIEDIREFEEKYGKIPAESFIIIRTGWEKYWLEPEKYHNNLIFPSLSQEAANFLLLREIVGIGIDTLSPDRPEDGYHVHQLILGSGKYIIENIANSGQMPKFGGYILALPMKIKNATEAPIRLIGLVENQQRNC